MPTSHNLMFDTAAIASVMGAFAGILPSIAALFGVIWYAIKIYEWARVRVFGREKDYSFD